LPFANACYRSPMITGETYPSFRDLRTEQSSYDIIGDVHGCAVELIELLIKLGYGVRLSGNGLSRACKIEIPAGRRAIFVGDLVDRGPNTPDVLRMVMHIVEQDKGYAVIGNHDAKFGRWLNGKNVKLAHGLERTAEQFASESETFKAKVFEFVAGLPPYLWLDQGRLVIAHAGIKEDMLGNVSGEIRRFCLYGETSGAQDEFGLPVRYNWAAEYSGETSIVYGHTPVTEAAWQNNTLCVDTGCCFGGHLTALRWPEREIVSVQAAEIYTPKVRPFGHPPRRPQTAS
jgi:hypothetical protein